MSDIALPGSIEPATASGPKLDHSVNPLTAILFLGVITAGIVFVAYSIYVDIDATGTKISNYLPFILLFVALMIALGFEFVNGFHDIANAVAGALYSALGAGLATLPDSFRTCNRASIAEFDIESCYLFGRDVSGLE